MKCFFIFVFSAFCAYSCSLGDGKDYSYEDVMNVIRYYNKKISKEKSIEMTMHGLDYSGEDKIYDGKIHSIALSYTVEKHIGYEEARALFYELVDDLLEKINTTEYLRKYFYSFPVTYKDLEFKLSFNRDKKLILKKGDVSIVYILLNKVNFHIVEIEGQEEIKFKKIAPNLSLVEHPFYCYERVIEEDPYTRKIIGEMNLLPPRKTTEENK